MGVEAEIRDAVAGFDAEFREGCGEFFAARAELGVSEGAIARDDSGFRAEDVDGAM
jgi:hypothetical protein